MDSEKEIVYKFMMTANRPFSGNDVFSNLQRQGIGKSAVDKALEQLTKEKKIVMKLNGKQKIYCSVQPDPTSDDQKEIQSMDEELLKTNELLREVERKYKESEIEMKKLQNTCSMEELKCKVTGMETIVSDLKSQLNKLQQSSKNNGNDLSEKEKVQVKKDYEKFTKDYRKRKRMCMDILDSILENYPKPKKALFEEIGIETDESVGMPSLLWVSLFEFSPNMYNIIYSIIIYPRYYNACNAYANFRALEQPVSEIYAVPEGYEISFYLYIVSTV